MCTMVFKSSPRRRLGVQAEIDSWRWGRQAPHAYGVQSRRLGGYDVDFSARRAPHGQYCERARVKSGAAGLRGKGCARGNQQQRCALGKGGHGAAREGFARGNRQQRRGRAYTSRRDVSGEVADLEIEGKGEGGWPAAPRILKRREVAAAPIQRACSPIPWLQPLLQSICLFFLFSNQSGRIPSTPSPSKSSWLFFRLPASTLPAAAQVPLPLLFFPSA